MTAMTSSLMSLAATSCIQLFVLDQIVRMGNPRLVLCQMGCHQSSSQQTNQGHMPGGTHQDQKDFNNSI